MGIVSACQISCCSLLANVYVIGKTGSAAGLDPALAWTSRVAAHLSMLGCNTTTSEVTYSIRVKMMTLITAMTVVSPTRLLHVYVYVCLNQ